jgi:N-acetylmuramoyl-L-alanine amidase
MKKTILSIVLLIILCICPPLFAWQDLCIDPGHGGSDPGVVTQIPEYYEKETNTDVAMALKEMIDFNGYYSAVFTRETDIYVLYTERAMVANRNNVYAFISIHHNAAVDTNGVVDTTKQYIHALYSSTQYTPYDPDIPEYNNNYAGRLRANDAQLALKIVLRLSGTWPERQYNSPENKHGSFTVLERSYMESAISEAAFISQPSEADMFHDNTNNHIEEEAGSLFDAYISWKNKNGIAMVDYSFVDQYNDNLDLEVDSWLRKVPYQGCWLENEVHSLTAIPFEKDGYYYRFHHWEHRNYTDGHIIDMSVNNPYNFTVDYTMDSTHWYRAIFSGGPFGFNILLPETSTTEINKNDTISIIWIAPPGVQRSCSLYVDISTNNKRNWTTLAGPLPFNYGMQGIKSASEEALSLLMPDGGKYLWHTPNINSDSCFIRIRGSDLAGNSGQVISHRFGLACWRPGPNFGADKTAGNFPLTVNFSDSSTHNPTSRLWKFGDGQTSTLQNPQHTYSSVGYYSVTLIATNACGPDTLIKSNYINVTCQPRSADFQCEDSSRSIGIPIIFWPKIHNAAPAQFIWIYGDGHIDSSGTYYGYHAYACPGTYSVTLRIREDCGTSEVTKSNFMTVTAPAGTPDTDHDGKIDGCDNCISIINPLQEDTDKDGIGDSCDICTDTDGDGYGNIGFPKNQCANDNCPNIANPAQTDSDGDGIGDLCDYICGDADANDKLNLLDVAYIINFLYRGGPAPNPLLRADANGSGSVNLSDVSYIVNFLYRDGPTPHCW